MNLILFPIPRG